MKNNKGFIISTTLYSAFGIMMITVASILFVLSNKQATMSSMTSKLKLCIEECDTPENICDGVCDDPGDGSDSNPCGTGKENTLACKILGENKLNVTSSKPTFKSTSTDNGLFVQENDITRSQGGLPTYYYRGNVTNNYILLTEPERGYKEYLMRIIRINEDGSIKVITQDNISNEPFNTKSHYPPSYGELKNVSTYIMFDGTNSSIRESLQNWFWGFSDRIYNTVVPYDFCNDISGIDFASGSNSGHAYDRINNMKREDYVKENILPTNGPTFICPYGSIVSKSSDVGLITIDEVVYGGSYLSNGSSFWTMTAAFGDDCYVGPCSLDCSWESCGTSRGVRPVINLRSDIEVKDGNGTSNDPYVIELVPW